MALKITILCVFSERNLKLYVLNSSSAFLCSQRKAIIRTHDCKMHDNANFKFIEYANSTCLLNFLFNGCLCSCSLTESEKYSKVRPVHAS